MTALIILAAIAALLFILLYSRIALSLSLDDSLTLTVRYLFLKIKLVPSEGGRVKLGDYTYKRAKKREAARAKKEAEKEAKKKAAEAEKKAAEAEKKQSGRTDGKKRGDRDDDGDREKDGDRGTKKKQSVVSLLYEIRGVIISLLKRAPKKLRVEISRLWLDVGGGDAAAAAVTYGVVTQAVGAALTLFSSYADLRVGGDAVYITPNFLSGKITARVRARVSVRVGSVFGLAFRFVFDFLRVKMTRGDQT